MQSRQPLTCGLTKGRVSTITLTEQQAQAVRASLAGFEPMS